MGFATGFTILLTVLIPTGATEQINLEKPTYSHLEPCEAAKARVVERYEKLHPNVKVENAECVKF